MKLLMIASAALSLTALCACSSFSSDEGEKAPESGAPAEDQWKYHVKKNYPQWQAPAETPKKEEAQPQAQAPADLNAPEAPAAKQPSGSEFFAEPPGFVVKDNYGAYVKPPEPVPAPAVFSSYKVKEGDSLWKISKLVYKKATLWEKIYEANKDVVKDPNRLKPGLELKIPAP